MRIVPDWKWVLLKSWSARLLALASVLSALEVVAQVMIAFEYDAGIPPGLLAALAGLVTLAALPARILAQRHSDED